MKKCSQCKEEKPLTEFHKRSCAMDGLEPRCKQCRAEYRKSHYDNNKDYYQEYSRGPQGRFSACKHGASRRNLEFELTLEQFTELTEQRCYYCNSFTKDKSHCGIDRMNNKIGYVLENCVPCCPDCNTWKSSGGVDEFVFRALGIANTIGKIRVSSIKLVCDARQF